MTERPAMNKPLRRQARPLAHFLKPCLGDVFARQGFTSAELVTRWREVAGPDIAAYCEPLKIQWPRTPGAGAGPGSSEPATLVLRVDGPAALEIQHMTGIILRRVNQFFGWQAVGRVALRQAPLSRRPVKKWWTPDPEATARLAADLSDVEDDGLRQALARLGVAIKRT